MILSKIKIRKNHAEHFLIFAPPLISRLVCPVHAVPTLCVRKRCAGINLNVVMMLILGDEANNCSVTKAYCCDFGAEYTFLKFVVMFAFLGFKHSFFTIYNIHSLGLSG